MWQPWHSDPRETADTLYLQADDIKNEDRDYFDKHYHFSSYDNYLLGFLGRVKFLREKLKWLFDLINIFNFAYKFIKLQLCRQNSYRFIDKTPPNAFRISFLEKLYPDAKFIYLQREAEANIESLVQAWNAPKRFQFKYRKYLNEKIEKYIKINFEDLLSEPDKTMSQICDFISIDYDKSMKKLVAEMPRVNSD